MKRPFRRHECRWEDNIRMDIGEIGWEGVDWIHLAQDRTNVGCCERSNEPLGSVKYRGFID
jgi:hypothetical protein